MSTSQYTTLVHAQPRGHPVGVTGGGAQVHQVRQVSPGGAPQLIFKVNYTTIDNLENHISLQFSISIDSKFDPYSIGPHL